ncbi:unnamed protein product, partial [Larinioides sclopetarius]
SLIIFFQLETNDFLANICLKLSTKPRPQQLLNMSCDNAYKIRTSIISVNNFTWSPFHVLWDRLFPFVVLSKIAVILRKRIVN